MLILSASSYFFTIYQYKLFFYFPLFWEKMQNNDENATFFDSIVNTGNLS
jgi:hypothetical protein